MLLVDIIDPAPYSELTVHPALRNIARELGWTYKVFVRGEEVNQQEGLIVFAAARMKLEKITTGELRKQYPNLKQVCLGSDTILYWKMKNCFEFIDPTETDLFLDLLDEVVEGYGRLGMKTDSWMWTASDDIIRNFMARPRLPKTKDFIGLFRCSSRGKAYRKKLWHIIGSRYQNNIIGHVSYDLNELYEANSSAQLALGTTSPSWTYSYRTMKGFRDWIAPACGTVLIYDNHPDILRKYWTCPTYDYDKPESIFELVASLDYEKVLAAQQAWILDNTIEKQFLRIFRKHGLVPNEN